MKTGLTYYNIETDRYQDLRIKRLKKQHGCAGISVYDYVLCTIYREKGCYAEWDEDRLFDVAEYFGLQESEVTEIVDYCCKVGLFSKTTDGAQEILTSKSIIRRYQEAQNKLRIRREALPNFINDFLQKSEKLQQENEKLLQESGKLQQESEKMAPRARERERERNKKEIQKKKTPETSSADVAQPGGLESSETGATRTEEQGHRSRIDYRQIARLWDEICVRAGYSSLAAGMTDARKEKIRLRLAEMRQANPASDPMDTLQKVFEKMAASSFMREGKWANFDWVFKNGTNWIKIWEGNYDGRGDHNGTRVEFHGDRCQQTQIRLGAGEFIATDGRRTYGNGKPTVPHDAPPRPSEKAFWNAETGGWAI